VPELPEVETVRRGLERHVVGRTVEDVRVLHPRAVRRHLAGPDEFCSALAGRELDGARRRGKYLWMSVGEDALLAHLGIKRALLDQSMISGIGNIYADEALWRAGLHWARPTETMNGPEVSRLLAAVREVLEEALEAGGTTFDSLYVDVNGDSGYFERSLAVYGREGLPCRRCGTPVRRDPFMNRSAYSCPRCQARPRRAHW